MTARRFPPPWSIEELDSCFVVKDGSGQKLGYFYFEEEQGRRSAAQLRRPGAFEQFIGVNCQLKSNHP
jgi:hypothetical protein